MHKQAAIWLYSALAILSLYRHHPQCPFAREWVSSLQNVSSGDLSSSQWEYLRVLSARANPPYKLLASTLFSPLEIESAALSNADFARVARKLMVLFEHHQISFEKTETLHEFFLDLNPRITGDLNHPPSLSFDGGYERKRLGSYYTHRALIGTMIRKAIAPKIKAIFDQNASCPDKSEQQILALRVLDLACGTGRFLLAALRALANALSCVRGHTSPTQKQQDMADVAVHCIYGVDKDSVAVDFARLAIRCGNSLLGVVDPQSVEQGIPNSAFTPMSKCTGVKPGCTASSLLRASSRAALLAGNVDELSMSPLAIPLSKPQSAKAACGCCAPGAGERCEEVSCPSENSTMA